MVLTMNVLKCRKSCMGEIAGYYFPTVKIKLITFQTFDSPTDCTFYVIKQLFFDKTEKTYTST